MLLAICLFLSSCSSHMDVTVTVVDSVSRAPIADVKVGQTFLHYKGIKQVKTENTNLGSTDSRGSFRVGRREMDSREYTISFSKEGYDKAWLLLYVVPGTGSKYQIVWPRRKPPVAIGKATGSTELVIPMRRK